MFIIGRNISITYEFVNYDSLYVKTKVHIG